MSADTEHPPIHEALAAVMADVTHVGKDGYNESQRFNFRGIDGLLNALGPALRRHRVVVMPEVLDSTHDQITTGKGGTAQRTMIRIAYHFHGPAGDHLTATVVGEALDSYDKATTKALSQAYKYALVQAFALPTDEPDADSFSEPPAPTIDELARLGGWTDEQHRKHAHAALAGKVKASGPDVAEQAKAFREEHGWPLPVDLWKQLDTLVETAATEEVGTDDD